jgi:hypothetical protein
MQTDNQKQEILATRVGGFGSSDAKMIIDFALNNTIKKQYYRRIAVFLGLTAVSDFSNVYTETGHKREKEIIDAYKKTDPESMHLSNPIFHDKGVLSNKYKCFSHIDMVKIFYPSNRHLFYEIKTSKKPMEEVLELYKEQLLWHATIIQQKDADEGGEYNPNISLLYYNEDFSGGEFDAKKLKEKFYQYKDEEIENFVKQIHRGFDVLTEFLEEISKNDYLELRLECKGKEFLSTPHLSDVVVQQMSELAHFMQVSKEMEQKELAVKEAVFQFMESKNIDIWDTEFFKFTRVKASKSILFDKDKFKNENAELYSQYLKESNRKSYVKLTLK